jgi:hypothetical protein
MSDTSMGAITHCYVENPSEKTDPIHVYLHDFCKGHGMITVTCWGTAWTAFWGAMGDRPVREFVTGTDADYMCKKLASSDRKSTKGEYVYRLKVATSVLNYLKDPANV